MIKPTFLFALVLFWLAQTSSSPSKVSDQDRATIGRSTNSVWYDAKDGSVHPTRYSKPINVDDRHDSIAVPVNRTTPTWWTSFWRTLGDFVSWIFRGWQILLLISLIAFLAIIAFIIFRNGFRLNSIMNKATDKSSLEREKAKLLDLPFEVEQTMFGLLAQAERYRAAGDYSKAVIYLFSHALVEMDGARCIRLERGKTNRVYLRELRDRDQLRGFTSQLVQAFEYAFFGKHVLSQEAFERIWQQVPAFDAHLKEIAAKPKAVLGSLVMICLATMLLPGCRYPLGTSYGLSEGTEAHTSPASVSLFRNMCNADGRTTLVVRSLSPRAITKLNAIVWTPDSFAPHSPETIAWIDKWLASGNKTLVYVGRDFSPMADYWYQSAEEFETDAVSKEDALHSREEQAAEQALLDKMRAGTRAKSATPWCLFDHTQAVEERVTTVKGPWSSELDPSKARLFVRSFPVGYAEQALATDKALFDRESDDTSTQTGASIPIPANASTTDSDFKWQPSDATMLEYIKALKEVELPALSPFLMTADDKLLIGEITKPNWGSSRVVVLANGSLISNLSLTNSENLALARKLLKELPKDNIGFLTGANDPRVRTDDSSDQQKGFEMLTVWPLNVISLHAAILGMLVLLAAFPIFGRAKLLPVKSTREFGQHIEAMGGLLFKSQDRAYALATIAEYFRNVRKEPTSPWAKIEPPAQQEPKSPFKT